MAVLLTRAIVVVITKEIATMIKDISGNRYGRLTVVEYAGKNRQGKSLWKCKCDCGNEKNITASDLSSGRVNSCGCLRKEVTAKKNFKDLTGKTFGKLQVIQRGKTDKSKKIHWICRCECGKICDVEAARLVSGRAVRCKDCSLKIVAEKNKKHGKCHSRIYAIYSGMKNRCFNSGNYSYDKYGKRGITVCEEWIGENGFDNFCKWAMENGYNDELSIDRIDVNGNYEPSNCRWVSIKEQQNNKRNNHFETYNGETKTLKQWSEDLGIDYFVLTGRINKCHWSFERAITETVKAR